MFEIRIHGRAGQGAKSASQFAAEAAMSQGKHVQAFPEYGPERSGAPVVAYVRVSDKKITTHQPVTNPDAVLVLDPSLTAIVNVAAGLDGDGALIVNSSEKPSELRKKLKFSGKTYVIDASRIALETIGRDIPNTAMLGALSGISEAVGKKALVSSIREKFAKKLGKEKTEGNVRSVEIAYQEARKQN